MSIFRILVLADIHGNVRAVTKILSVIQKQNLRIDLILIAGDLPETTPVRLMLQYIISHGNLSKSKYTKWVYKERGRPQFVQNQIKSIKTTLTLLSSLEVPIVYVPGNVDSHEVQEFIKNWSASEIYFLTATALQIGSFRILGYGGSQFSPKRYKEPLCDMEFYPHDFLSRLEPLFKLSKQKKPSIYDILITHEPPAFRYNTANGIITGGSISISKLINHIKPKFTIFGHYHELPIVKKGIHTVYVNPGPFTCYYFALIDIEENSIQVSLKKMNPVRLDLKNIIYGYRLLRTNIKRDLRFE